MSTLKDLIDDALFSWSLAAKVFLKPTVEREESEHVMKLLRSVKERADKLRNNDDYKR